MKVGIFSAKAYDEAVFNSANPSSEIELHYIPAHLDCDTVAICSQFDVVCVFVNDDVSAAVVDALANHGVKHIALRCAGYNNVDLEQAKARGLAVSHVPAYSPEAVAEHAVALMLTLNRKMNKAYNRVREGNFDLTGLTGFTMAGKTAGVVGTGNIGHATAHILLGFGCKVVCFDPYPKQELIDAGAQYVTFDHLLEQSDIITLHCPLNEQSYHLINDQTVARMRDGVMLINTSRGGLIDTHAVINGLKSRKIGYLGLDVYEMESELFFRDHSFEIIQDDVFERLLTFHNVMITGHQGFFTQEALDQIASTTLNNIHKVAGGETESPTFLVAPPESHT
ncbi:2-hydroxyacid dehydrogenase [Alteromonas aestuariivivens]|uniref:2-hydroxyacid dehydrogenase n=1 Tax=Alteromonas aestuariivivens TaxID=1938339 RepID=A0A3D8M8P3_9ALTE|nr:2-hydroxyacid dehydrogenase [Alteromonas aestuariivivens]